MSHSRRRSSTPDTSSTGFQTPCLSLTLIFSEDWSQNKNVIERAKGLKALQKTGNLLTCNERFGGNTLRLLYPYLHLSRQPFIIKDRLKDAIAFEKELPSNVKATLEQGSYMEVDQFSNKSRFTVMNSDHIVFIGVKTNDKDGDVIESTWRKWSKVSLLSAHLLNHEIELEGVSFLRQIAPKNMNLFFYCFLVAVRIRTKLQRLKCLNVLQRLRGSLIPGYVSLFERSGSDGIVDSGGGGGGGGYSSSSSYPSSTHTTSTTTSYSQPRWRGSRSNGNGNSKNSRDSWERGHGHRRSSTPPPSHYSEFEHARPHHKHQWLQRSKSSDKFDRLLDGLEKERHVRKMDFEARDRKRFPHLHL